jgi:hypothetical protein
VVVVAFLPSALRLTYFRDDWYYMLDGHSAGPRVFLEMFQADRPARGLVFASLFSAFGAYPLPDQILSFVFRLLSGVAAYWLFRMLWPRSKRAPLWGALLFALYPGYLWWVAGIEYLPMMLSLLLQVISIALTVAAVQSASARSRVLYWSLSVLSGWAYLALVEYAIGLEVFRFMCVYLVLGQARTCCSAGARLRATFRIWLPALVIPAGFLTWWLLVFDNARSATDLAAQLAVLQSDPILTALWWAVRLMRSALNVGVFAWAVPLSENLYDLRLKDLGSAFGAALIVAASVAAHRAWRLGQARPTDHPPPDGSPGDESLWIESLQVGGFGVLASVMPIVVGNRLVTFAAYSHYALPGSLPAVVIVVSLLQLMRSPRVGRILLAGLLVVAVLTHYAVATRALIEQLETARFWQQVTWRAPDLKPGTTLFVKYPSFDYGGDGSIVWGPANLIYDASPSKVVPIRYEISALEVSSFILDEMASGVNVGPVTYRTYTIPVDFGKVLVMSQSRPGTCVRVIDGRWPLLSVEDPLEIALAAQYSRAEMIDVEGHGATAPDWLFGPEPVRGWCYFFEKAELALQRGDFEEVVRLAEQAEQEDQSPNEGIEWMPFARAYAQLGMVEKIRAVGSKLNVNPADRRQACHTLYENQHLGYELPAEMVPVIHDLFCN